MAAFQEILDVLPGRLQTLDFSAAQELRLRVGQAPAVLELAVATLVQAAFLLQTMPM